MCYLNFCFNLQRHRLRYRNPYSAFLERVEQDVTEKWMREKFLLQSAIENSSEQHSIYEQKAWQEQWKSATWQSAGQQNIFKYSVDNKLKEMQTTPEIFNQPAGSLGKWDLLFACAFPNWAICTILMLFFTNIPSNKNSRVTENQILQNALGKEQRKNISWALLLEKMKK